MMPEYTWDDWFTFLGVGIVEFIPLNHRAYDNANSMLKYYTECMCAAYPEAYKRSLEILFDMPFEDLPTVINEVIEVNKYVYILVHKIAEWRLIIGK